MIPTVQPTYDTAVVVGRFQVADLHDGHIELLTSIAAHHSKLIVVLGVAPVRCTYYDPLDFESRKAMIQQEFPEALVVPILDDPSDEIWSANLDAMIRQITGFHELVALYGSRDSFLPHYFGSYPALELIATGELSGTNQRYEVARKVRASADFRAGVIHASQARRPVAYHTVDIVTFDPTYEYVVLARKPGEKLWGFPGGFVDPEDDGSETAAIRELREETGLTVHTVDYIGSYKIHDFRYLKGPDKIITTLYAGVVSRLDNPVANDDIADAEWKHASLLNPTSQSEITPRHRVLATAANMFAAQRKANMGTDH